MIYWNCTICRAEIEAENDEAGDKIDCPACRALQFVPEVSEVGGASPGSHDTDGPTWTEVAEETRQIAFGRKGRTLRYVIAATIALLIAGYVVADVLKLIAFRKAKNAEEAGLRIRGR